MTGRHPYCIAVLILGFIALSDVLRPAAADEFITFRPTQTDCPKCQPLVDRYNGVVGDIDRGIAEYRRLQAESRHREQDITDTRLRITELDREENDLFEAPLGPNFVTEHRARMARSNAIRNEIETLEEQIPQFRKAIEDLATAVDAQKVEIQKLQGSANDLYRQIADCEFTCTPDELTPPATATGPPGQPVTGNVGLDGEVVRPARTNCEKCAAIADEINRIIGDLKSARGQRRQVLRDLESTRDEIEKVNAQERELRRQYEETLFRQIELRQAGGDVSVTESRLTDLAFKIGDI
jgi:chromosome segregation ATPase